MPITIRDVDYDTMGDACRRLNISRSSMLRYIKDKFFTKPPEHPQGRGKTIRYFPEQWYEINGKRLAASREKGS